MLEAALVFDKEHRILGWHLPKGRTAVSLPDSRALWELLWDNRAILGGVAHSHPPGLLKPSQTDLETFKACELGLGLKLQWWIASGTQARCYRWSRGAYRAWKTEFSPPWLGELLKKQS